MNKPLVKQLPAVRFVVATGVHRVGDIIRPNGVHRDWLMSRGFVEYVPEPDPAKLAAKAAVISANGFGKGLPVEPPKPVAPATPAVPAPARRRKV